MLMLCILVNDVFPIFSKLFSILVVRQLLCQDEHIVLCKGITKV